MTDAEILTLVDRLERCELSGGDFHHRDHITVAVAYLYASDVSSAMEKTRAAISRFAAHHHSTLYHETITRFWILLAEKHIDRKRCLCKSVERTHVALTDKNLIYEFYTRERLHSSEAKSGWVEPDLKSI